MPVMVRIMGKDFQFRCEPEQESSVQAAAAHLDQRMREIREKGRVMGAEQCAIMAAVNIAHKLLGYQNDPDRIENDQCRERVQLLINDIDDVLQD